MRTGSARWMVALALAAAAPAARAFTWRAGVGAVYAREDRWGPRETTPHLDLDLNLSIDGAVVHPNAFRYGGEVAYRRAATTPPNGEETIRASLDYRLQATLFGARTSPLSFTIRASQREETLSGGGEELGYTSREYGGDARILLVGNNLGFSYSRSESVQRVPSQPDAERNAHAVTVSATQGGHDFTYSARYSGTFTDGTFAADNAHEHRVTVIGAADLNPRTRFQFTDEFFRRGPTVESPFNPRQETNLLSVAGSAYASASSFHQFGYTYQRGLQIAPLAEDVERIGHALSYGYDRVLSNPEWRLGGTLGTVFSQDRLGGDEAASASQSVGGSAQWRRTRGDRTVDIRAAPSIGLTESDGSIRAGYGASAGIGLQRTASTPWQLSYDATYSKAIGDAGWSFRHTLLGALNRPIAAGHLNANVIVSGELRDSPFYGAGGTRTISAGAAYTRRRVGASATASLTSGLANAISASGGSGLFLSLPYDSHTYAATLTASVLFTSRLALSSEAQLTSTLMKDRPTRDDLIATARLAYSTGALAIGIDERFTVVRVEGVESRYNQVMLTASRSFGSRF